MAGHDKNQQRTNAPRQRAHTAPRSLRLGVFFSRADSSSDLGRLRGQSALSRPSSWSLFSAACGTGAPATAGSSASSGWLPRAYADTVLVSARSRSWGGGPSSSARASSAPAVLGPSSLVHPRRGGSPSPLSCALLVSSAHNTLIVARQRRRGSPRARPHTRQDRIGLIATNPQQQLQTILQHVKQ